MLVLLVLMGAWIVFRGAGAFGVAMFATWHDSARFALAVLFVFTGVSHFTRLKHEMARMVPGIFPNPMAWVYLTGVLELLGAAGLIFARTRPAASLALAAMLVALFPANIKAAREGLTVGGKPATALWLRAPMQVFFIGMLLWAGMR